MTTNQTRSYRIGSLLAITIASFGCAAGSTVAPNARAATSAALAKPGFIVVAPDRGFLGNQETRTAYRQLAAEQSARLVFLAGDNTKRRFDTAVHALIASGVNRVVVLPMYVATTHPDLARLRRLASAHTQPRIAFAKPFGRSYLAVEALADRLRAIDRPAGRRLIVVGYGAADAAMGAAMASDYQRLVDAAARGLGFEGTRVVIARSGSNPRAEQRRLQQSLATASAGGERVVIVPFHLGKKLDSMMSLTAMLRRGLPSGVELTAAEVTPHPAVAMWMRREANRHSPVTAQHLGVVILAHGSDFEWNETMRRALAKLERRYLVEYAFSMADQKVVEPAVRRLEKRGARWIVVVRVFGLASSFRRTVERMIGLDIEQPRGEAHAREHHHGHGHGGMRPPARIRSAAMMTTVGGLEAHPLFAEALLDRAAALSTDPARETVILVAHGSGDDTANRHWLGLLEQLAAHMRKHGGPNFRAIRVATWREDWPVKRAPWIARVRTYLDDAAQNGGRAIIIPARTNAQGPARQLLPDQTFAYGRGFAPHPKFARWVEAQIVRGERLLRHNARGHDRVAASPGSAHHHH